MCEAPTEGAHVVNKPFDFTLARQSTTMISAEELAEKTRDENERSSTPRSHMSSTPPTGRLPAEPRLNTPETSPHDDGDVNGDVEAVSRRTRPPPDSPDRLGMHLVHADGQRADANANGHGQHQAGDQARPETQRRPGRPYISTRMSSHHIERYLIKWEPSHRYTEWFHVRWSERTC